VIGEIGRVRAPSRVGWVDSGIEAAEAFVTKAVAEFRVRMAAHIGFDLFPVSAFAANFFAACTDGEQAFEGLHLGQSAFGTDARGMQLADKPRDANSHAAKQSDFHEVSRALPGCCGGAKQDHTRDYDAERGGGHSGSQAPKASADHHREGEKDECRAILKHGAHQDLRQKSANDGDNRQTEPRDRGTVILPEFGRWSGHR